MGATIQIKHRGASVITKFTSATLMGHHRDRHHRVGVSTLYTPDPPLLKLLASDTTGDRGLPNCSACNADAPYLF